MAIGAVRLFTIAHGALPITERYTHTLLPMVALEITVCIRRTGAHLRQADYLKHS